MQVTNKENNICHWRDNYYNNWWFEFQFSRTTKKLPLSIIVILPSLKIYMIMFYRLCTLCAMDAAYWYSCRNIYGFLWTYDKLHIIVFIVMKMVIIHLVWDAAYLCWDELVSCGCIHCFCSHTSFLVGLCVKVFDIVLYTLWKGCSLWIYIVEIEHTRCIQVGEIKNGNGIYRATTNKNSPNGYHVDQSLSRKTGLQSKCMQTKKKSILPLFHRFETKLYSFHGSLLSCPKKHQRYAV